MDNKKALRQGKVVSVKYSGKVPRERILAEMAKVLLSGEDSGKVHKDD